MKLKEVSDLVIESSDEIEFDLEVKMEGDEAAHIMAALSDTIYKDKPGSMVREITTNAWDANMEAGSDEPVYLEITGNQLIIKDAGPGFTVDRMRDVFVKFGKSTKRGANDEHGGFGIGSKTPLAYTKNFTLKTWVDGVCSIYTVHKTKGLPRVKRLGDPFEEDHPNGSHVIITIHPGDTNKIQEAISRQLIYFDNLIVHGVPSWSNDYQLHSGEHFIINSKFPPRETNICLGQVSYPLDRQTVEKVLSSRFHNDYRSTSSDRVNQFMQMQLGLTFKIGDLPVILSREEIEYGDGVELVVEKKIHDVIDELEELYIQQKDEEKSILRLIGKTETPVVNIQDIRVSLEWFEDLQSKDPQHYPGFSKRAWFKYSVDFIKLFAFSHNNRVSQNLSETYMQGYGYLNEVQTAAALVKRALEDGVYQPFEDIWYLKPGENFNNRTAKYIESVKDHEKPLQFIKDTREGVDPADFDHKYWNLILEELDLQQFSDIEVPADFDTLKKAKPETQFIMFNGDVEQGHRVYYRNLQKGIRAVLAPHAQKDEAKKFTDAFDIRLALCKGEDYDALLNDYRFITMKEFTATRAFREKMTFFKIAQEFPKLTDVRSLLLSEWNYYYLNTEDYKTAEEIKNKLDNPYNIWNADKGLIGPFLDYVDSHGTTFYRNDWITVFRKMVAIHQCDERKRVECLESQTGGRELIAKIYLKILKNPITNEYVKKYLLSKTG
jgi:hypothetical protein